MSGRRKTSSKRKTDNNIYKQPLVKNGFFPSEIIINKKDIFPMVVLATMSSGKSTLINALLGEQILPSKNAACTAKKCSILDDDQERECGAYITYYSGKTEHITENFASKLQEANEDEKVMEILIKRNIRGITNSDRSLLIIDTPGPNNSRDDYHKSVTMSVLDNVTGGMLLYVINATQFGINDDAELLQILREYCCSHGNMDLLFVINKIDEFDEEKGEHLEELVTDVKNYLEENGFTDPEIIPISALSALVFKKVLNQDELTRLEKRFFKKVYDYFNPEKHDLRTYAVTNEISDNYGYISLDDEKYRIGSIIQAIERTGITLVEEYIQRSQIRSGYQSSNYIYVKGEKL